MAKLPDSTALGYGGGQDSGRAIASYAVSAVGKGMEGFGSSAMELGQTLRLNAERAQRQDDQIASARAESNFLVKKAEIEGSYQPGDANYTNWTKDYNERIAKARDESAGMIPEGRARELWTLKKADDIARGQVAVDGMVRARNRDAGLADTNTQLETLRNTALASKDEETRSQTINAGSDLIERAKRAGWISEQDAVATRQKWAKDYATAAIRLMPAAERIEVLSGPVKLDERTKQAYDFFVSKGYAPAQAAGIVGNLVAESGLNSAARNRGDGRDGSDSIGIGQWNAERSRALQSFAATRGKTSTDFQTQLEFVDQELTTSEGKAGEALRGAQDARSATSAFIGFERPAGWSPGNPEGGHNFRGRLRHAETILAAYGGGQQPAVPQNAKLASILPPDMQQGLLREAWSDYGQTIRDTQKKLQSDAADLTVKMSDDIASIENSGKGQDGLSPDQVSAVLGNERTREWQTERGRARRVYEALDGIETLPASEVEQRLQSLEPRPGSQGYAADMETYRKAEKRAKAFLEARRADPALAVETFPSVKNARANAQYEGTDEKKTLTPDSAQAIVKSRMAAQSQLGIADPMAVTRSEARVIGRQLRYIGEDDGVGLNRFLSSLQRTYGEQTQAVLTSTLQHEGVNRDLSVAAVSVLNKMASDPQAVKAAAEVLGINQQPTQVADNRPPAPAPPMPAVTYDAPDLRRLYEGRDNPDLVAGFNQKYGANKAQEVLPDLVRRMGGSR